MNNSQQKPDPGPVNSPPTLTDLLEGITPGNTHPETDSGVPVGEEVW